MTKIWWRELFYMIQPKHNEKVMFEQSLNMTVSQADCQRRWLQAEESTAATALSSLPIALVYLTKKVSVTREEWTRRGEMVDRVQWKALKRFSSRRVTSPATYFIKIPVSITLIYKIKGSTNWEAGRPVGSS